MQRQQPCPRVLQCDCTKVHAGRRWVAHWARAWGAKGGGQQYFTPLHMDRAAQGAGHHRWPPSIYIRHVPFSVHCGSSPSWTKAEGLSSGSSTLARPQLRSSALTHKKGGEHAYVARWSPGIWRRVCNSPMYKTSKCLGLHASKRPFPSRSDCTYHCVKRPPEPEKGRGAPTRPSAKTAAATDPPVQTASRSRVRKAFQCGREPKTSANLRLLQQSPSVPRRRGAEFPSVRSEASTIPLCAQRRSHGSLFTRRGRGNCAGRPPGFVYSSDGCSAWTRHYLLPRRGYCRGRGRDRCG